MSREQRSITKQDLRGMSGEQGPVTIGDLRDEMEKLVLRAHRNGVEVDGERHELRSDDPDVPDWEVDIWEL